MLLQTLTEAPLQLSISAPNKVTPDMPEFKWFYAQLVLRRQKVAKLKGHEFDLSQNEDRSINVVSTGLRKPDKQVPTPEAIRSMARRLDPASLMEELLSVI